MTKQLETVRRSVFEMEDHITCAEEGVQALEGFCDMKNAHAYGAAINIIADVLNAEIKGIREQFNLAWEALNSEDKPPPKAVEE